MPKRRREEILSSRRVRGVNEGSDCFTDFFQQDHVMNENPTKGFHQFMNDHDVDLQRGELIRRRRPR